MFELEFTVENLELIFILLSLIGFVFGFVFVSLFFTIKNIWTKYKNKQILNIKQESNEK